MSRSHDPAMPGEYIEESARSTPVLAHTEVLVIGGGPSGCAAAIAAARAGAQVMLVERQQRMPGLAGSGLTTRFGVMTGQLGELLVGGLAQQLLTALPVSERFVAPRDRWGSTEPVDLALWGPVGMVNGGAVACAPVANPAAVNVVTAQWLEQASVTVRTRTLAVTPIRQDERVIGAVMEDGQRRYAIRAQVVIDASGSQIGFATALHQGIEADIALTAPARHTASREIACLVTGLSGGPAGLSLPAELAAQGLAVHPAWRSDLALLTWPLGNGFAERTHTVEQTLDALIAKMPALAGASVLNWREQSRPAMPQAHAAQVPPIPPPHRQLAPDNGACLALLPSMAHDSDSWALHWHALPSLEYEAMLGTTRALVAATAQAGSLADSLAAAWTVGQAAGIGAAITVQSAGSVFAPDVQALACVVREQRLLPVDQPIQMTVDHG